MGVFMKITTKLLIFALLAMVSSANTAGRKVVHTLDERKDPKTTDHETAKQNTKNGTKSVTDAIRDKQKKAAIDRRRISLNPIPAGAGGGSSSTPIDLMVDAAEDDEVPGAAGAGSGSSGAGSGSSMDPVAGIDFSFGLPNYCGNDCFINAMIQCVFSSPSHLNYLHALFTSPDFEANVARLAPNKDNGLIHRDIPIYQAIVRTFKALYTAYLAHEITSLAEAITQKIMREFTQALRSGFGTDDNVREHRGQGDADEAYTILFDALKWINTNIGLEEIQEKITTTCASGHSSSRGESQRTINLRIPTQDHFITLAELLEQHQAPELLNGANQYACEHCGDWDEFGNGAPARVDANKAISFSNQPAHIVLNIKRSRFNIATMGKYKIHTPVVPGARIELNGTRYILTGAAVHRGASSTRGHWVAWKRGICYDATAKTFKSNAQWHRANDREITPLITDEKYDEDEETAMFFYEREDVSTCFDSEDLYDFMGKLIEKYTATAAAPAAPVVPPAAPATTTTPVIPAAAPTAATPVAEATPSEAPVVSPAAPAGLPDPTPTAGGWCVIC